MSSPLPTPGPTVTPETAPFWEAAAQGVLRLPRCRACAAVIWYPRPQCPRCGSSDVEWFAASGRGTVYSFTITRRAGGPYGDAAPYVLAYVELDEGPRMMTNVVGCPPESVYVGQVVVAEFHDSGDGAALVRFRPADRASEAEPS